MKKSMKEFFRVACSIFLVGIGLFLLVGSDPGWLKLISGLALISIGSTLFFLPALNN